MENAALNHRNNTNAKNEAIFTFLVSVYTQPGCSYYSRRTHAGLNKIICMTSVYLACRDLQQPDRTTDFKELFISHRFEI